MVDRVFTVDPCELKPRAAGLIWGTSFDQVKKERDKVTSTVRLIAQCVSKKEK
jgi:hypothetical protein